MAEDNTTSPPRIVTWLGYGGLIPFITLATASLLDHHHGTLWNDALLAYSAIILSFIGALHWGLAMSLPGLAERQRSACFAWSVVPALIAWPAALLSPIVAAPLLVSGFIAHYFQDRRLVRLATLPSWYLPLRMRLSTIAVACLVAGIFASWV